MKIVVNSSGEYQDMINSYYNLEKYDDGSDKSVLFQGYSTSKDSKFKAQYKDYPRRVYLNLEAPCAFASTLTTVEEQKYFTEVFTICPYTAEWLNKSTDTNFIPIPFPFNMDSFKHLKHGEKIYDTMYMGTLMNHEHRGIINVMKKYKYIHTSLFARDNPTHTNINSAIKWDLLNKTKISIAMNLAPITDRHISFITKYPDWSSNEAFKDLKSGYIPQFKPRIIESMVCKTLVLVRRDQWNVIERWFEPDKHFIYWDNLDDLDNKIQDILKNYDNYQNIIDNAYEKVMDYEINNIFKRQIDDKR